jgi:hypothetical protein
MMFFSPYELPMDFIEQNIPIPYGLIVRMKNHPSKPANFFEVSLDLRAG